MREVIKILHNFQTWSLDNHLRNQHSSIKSTGEFDTKKKVRERNTKKLRSVDNGCENNGTSSNSFGQ